jgi:signal recognition particle subunit SRP54
MFASLSERLTKTVRHLSGRGRITENNIQDTLREIRLALLEADVALSVVKELINSIRIKALGQEVMKSLTPGQALIKIVNAELIHVLGDQQIELNLQTTPPAVILFAGLQGSGKTTSVVKLARWLTETQKKKVMVVSTDIYRPAAIEQLKILANEVGILFFPSESSESPVAIAEKAVVEATKQFVDVLLVDTAGRLHIDDEMMAEIKNIHKAIKPIETLFTVDSMTGQDAANTAKAFNDALPLTGIIPTKIDGDARGGAILSMRMITGKPIKFLGVGEKTQNLEIFHPDRIASRILGMGDVLSLIEEVQQNVDQEKAKKLAQKIQKQKSFDLEDFRDQLQQMQKMGGMMSIMGKIPGLSSLPQNVRNQVDDKVFIKIETIINSMTPKERRRPEIINGSRKKRIARGSGTDIPDVNRLLKQFEQMQKMMKKFSKKGNMLKLMQQMKNGLPNGMF